MGYYAIMRRKKILPLEMTCMDLEGIMLSEMPETDKQCMISLTVGSKHKTKPKKEELINNRK